MANNVKTEAISGEAIIEAYHSGDVAGEITYGKLCKAIDLLNRWEPQAIVEFLQQFVHIADLLDHRCKQLVHKFGQIEWHVVPGEIRPQFVKMLRDIGIQHVCHTETIMRCFVEQLLARVRPVHITESSSSSKERSVMNFELCTTIEEQENIFGLAHDGLTVLLTCFPAATNRVAKIIRQCFPHHTIPSARYISYVRNLILLCEHIPHCRGDIFSVIIDGLSQLDAVLTRTEMEDAKVNVSDAGLNVFLLDEEYQKKVTEVHSNNDRIEKLDTCMCYMFAYIARVHGQEIPPDKDCSWLLATCQQQNFFEELLVAFEEHLLMAQSLRNVSFLWFYLCSLDKKYQTRFMNWLWSFVTRLNQAPNDWKKAQGAACYIGSMLSRASYVDLRLAMEWLERLLRWCTTYVNEMVDRSAGSAAGAARHGTFYAVFQAFLVVFCFRYREIVQAGEMQRIHHWGLGHVVHSTLEPLSYTSRPVALCFATISRSMQLIYVNHILPTVPEEKLPFDPRFPFDAYYLTRSASFIGPLIRKFSPLAEDADLLKSESLWKQANEELDCQTLRESIGSWEFLEDVMRDRTEFPATAGAEVMDFTEERNSSLTPTNEFLTIYSSSPGLQQFKAHFANRNRQDGM